ncbi:MAG: type II secretion system F family protein [Coxiellaceae bacterium]|nr:MAG: type II secretion system F family protein [Coxiellaceae bacterium]
MNRTEPNKILFHWQGMHRQGKRMRGTMLASDSQAVIAQLEAQQIIALQIKSKRFQFHRRKSSAINTAQLGELTQQLAALLQAGMPLATGLQILADSQINQNTASLLIEIKSQLESGYSFSEVLAKYPQYFNKLFCHLIAIGEQTGTLIAMLTQLSRQLIRLSATKNKIRKALVYPFTVSSVAVIITFALISFVLPQFTQLFQEAGADLPFYSKLVLAIASHLPLFTGLFVVIILLTIFGIKIGIRHSPSLGLKLARWQLRLPILGRLIQQAIIARIMRILATTLAAGIPLADALPLINLSARNLVFQTALQEWHTQMQNGASIYQAMSMTQTFPPAVTSLVAIAEESGTLTVTLEHIAANYESQLETTLENFTKLFEPVIMLVLGCLLGGLIAALYLPIFHLGNVL